MFNNASVMITGGTGSFGKEYVKTLLSRYKPRKIIIFSRDELKQYEMEQDYHQACMRYFIGDVRDRDRLIQAMNGVDYVIPGNDDAMRAIQLYASGIADAVLEGRSAGPSLSVGEDDFVELDENGNPRPRAGRARQGEVVQAGAGVEIHAKPGEQIAKGSPLFTLHTETPERFAHALEAVQDGWSIGEKASATLPLIVDRITA